MTEITDIFIKITAILLAATVTCLVKEAARYVKTKRETEEKTALDRFIYELVQAAEQMLKDEDPSGSVRLGYVQQMLIEAGYELTDAICATIEAYVYEINAEGGGENDR